MNVNKGIVSVRFTKICQTPLAPSLNAQLFDISQEVVEHLKVIIGLLIATRTENLDLSSSKRILLFLNQLLLEAVEASIILAAHGFQRPLFQYVRSSHEYVARALYFAENPDKTVAHLKDIPNKAERLFDDVDIVPEVSASIAARVDAFAAANPDWKRPHDIGLKDILINLYGVEAADEMYNSFHKLYSSPIHGHLDFIPNVIEFVDGGTNLKPHLPYANHAMVNILRFAFTMIALDKRTLGIQSLETIRLYRRFIPIKNSLGKVRNAFPATRKMRRMA